jgi:hypothetical protein
MNAPAEINCDEWKEQFAKNKLMLRLWQSGRELFHSNMLAYLLDDPHYGPEILSYLWDKQIKYGEYHIRILREYKNIDLCVMLLPKIEPHSPDRQKYWEDWRDKKDKLEWKLLLIENKFKSLPDRDQLQRYTNHVPQQKTELNILINRLRALCDMAYVDKPSDESHNGNQPLTGKGNRTRLGYEARFVILEPNKGGDDIEATLVCKTNTRKIERKIDWKRKNWTEIAKRLATPKADPDFEDEFIQRYRCIVRAACDLHLEMMEKLLNTNPIAFAVLDSLRECFRPLRLHDFIDKWRYAWLANQLVEVLCRKGGWVGHVTRNRYNTEIKTKAIVFDGKYWIQITPFFSRGTGGVDATIYRKGESAFAMAVQLQGNELKLFYIHRGSAENNDKSDNNTLRIFKEILQNEGPWKESGMKRPISKTGLGTYKQDVLLPREDSLNGSNPCDGSDLTIESAFGRILYPKVCVWSCKESKGKNNASVDPQGQTQENEGWTNKSLTNIADELAELICATIARWNSMPLCDGGNTEQSR